MTFYLQNAIFLTQRDIAKCTIFPLNSENSRSDLKLGGQIVDGCNRAVRKTTDNFKQFDEVGEIQVV